MAMPGSGLLVQSNPMGASFSLPRPPVFGPPFTVALGSNSVTISRGTVEGKEPMLNGVPISGAGGPQPVLVLDPSIATAAGESWIVLELVPNAQGRLDDQSNLTIAHRNQSLSADDQLGRQSVAMVLWQQRVAVRVVQVLEFNIAQYQRVTLPAGMGPARHLFI